MWEVVLHQVEDNILKMKGEPASLDYLKNFLWDWFKKTPVCDWNAVSICSVCSDFLADAIVNTRGRATVPERIKSLAAQLASAKKNTATGKHLAKYSP